MDKIKEVWAKFVGKVGGKEVAIAIVGGVVLAIVVHPVVGIVAGGAYFAYSKGWLTKAVDKVKGALGKD